MAESNRTKYFATEINPKEARWPVSSIVAALLSEALELNGTKITRADPEYAVFIRYSFDLYCAE